MSTAIKPSISHHLQYNNDIKKKREQKSEIKLPIQNQIRHNIRPRQATDPPASVGNQNLYWAETE